MLNNADRGRQIIDALEMLDADLIREAETLPQPARRFHWSLIPACAAAALLIAACMMLILHRGDGPVPPDTTAPSVTLPPVTGTVSPPETTQGPDTTDHVGSSRYPYPHVIFDGAVYALVDNLHLASRSIVAHVEADSSGEAEIDPTKVSSNRVQVGEPVCDAAGADGINYSAEFLLTAYGYDGMRCTFVRTERLGAESALDGRRLSEILPAADAVSQMHLCLNREEYVQLRISDQLHALIADCLESIITDEPISPSGASITLRLRYFDLSTELTLYENGIGFCLGETLSLPGGLYDAVMTFCRTLPENSLSQGADGRQAMSPYYGALFGLDSALTDLIPADEVTRYTEVLFRGSFDFNERSFCRYFGITEAEYRTAIAPYADYDRYGDGGQYIVYQYPRGIFGSYDDFIDTFVGSLFRGDYTTEECIPGDDCPHTFTYHTIADELIDLVGPDRYADFRTQYWGTEDFNVLHFIDFFSLTEPQVRQALAQSTDALPAYRIEYLFGDAAMQREYFYIRGRVVVPSLDDRYPYPHVIYGGSVYAETDLSALPTQPITSVSASSYLISEADANTVAANCLSVGTQICRLAYSPELFLTAQDDSGVWRVFMRREALGGTGRLGGRKAAELLAGASLISRLYVSADGEEYRFFSVQDAAADFVDACLEAVFSDAPLTGTGTPITVSFYLGSAPAPTTPTYTITLYENGVGQCIGESLHLPDGLYAAARAFCRNQPEDAVGNGPDDYGYRGIWYDSLFHLNGRLIELVPDDEVTRYTEVIFANSFDFNVRAFCRYFGITEAEYRDAMAYFDDPSYPFGQYAIHQAPRGIFGNHDDFINTFVRIAYRDSYATEECIPGDNCPHTFTYHTIADELINLVGRDRYADFRAKYWGTEDFNVLHFIDTFDLSLTAVRKAIEQSTDPLPAYRVNYLFGDAAMQREYFYVKAAQDDVPAAETLPVITPPEENTPQLTSGGSTVTPVAIFAYATQYTEYGWLSGSGAGAKTALQQAGELPVLRLQGETAIRSNTPCSVTRIAVFDKNFNSPMRDVHSQVGYQLDNLHLLPPGEYSAAITVEYQGRFIEEKNEHEIRAEHLLVRIVVE